MHERRWLASWVGWAWSIYIEIYISEETVAPHPNIYVFIDIVVNAKTMRIIVSAMERLCSAKYENNTIIKSENTIEMIDFESATSTNCETPGDDMKYANNTTLNTNDSKHIVSTRVPHQPTRYDDGLE